MATIRTCACGRFAPGHVEQTTPGQIRHRATVCIHAETLPGAAPASPPVPATADLLGAPFSF